MKVHEKYRDTPTNHDTARSTMLFIYRASILILLALAPFILYAVHSAL
jgi:hypothetical protein